MAIVEDDNEENQPSREGRMRSAVISGVIAIAAPALTNRRRTRNCIAGLAAVCTMLMLDVPARAASRANPEDVAACKALSDYAADLIRAGQTVMTTRAQLRRCVRIQRAERRRVGRPAEAGRN